jgi:hypothetical protein
MSDIMTATSTRALFGIGSKPTPSGHAGRGIVSSLGAVLGFVLLPKCPLCVAALLGAAGVGAGAASLMAPLLRPAAASLAILLASVLTIRALVRGARAMRRARVAAAGQQRETSCCAGRAGGPRTPVS